MATDFKILRGNKENLVDEYGNSTLPSDKLVNGYWYLTNDTAEVYVCLLSDPSDPESKVLRKINECNIDNDFSSLESFEARLEKLEAQEKLHTFAYKAGFPKEGKGELGHMYVAVDEGMTYVYWNDTYLPVSGKAEEPEIIFGGTAD